MGERAKGKQGADTIRGKEPQETKATLGKPEADPERHAAELLLAMRALIRDAPPDATLAAIRNAAVHGRMGSASILLELFRENYNPRTFREPTGKAAQLEFPFVSAAFIRAVMRHAAERRQEQTQGRLERLRPPDAGEMAQLQARLSDVQSNMGELEIEMGLAHRRIGALEAERATMVRPRLEEPAGSHIRDEDSRAMASAMLTLERGLADEDVTSVASAYSTVQSLARRTGRGLTASEQTFRRFILSLIADAMRWSSCAEFDLKRLDALRESIRLAYGSGAPSTLELRRAKSLLRKAGFAVSPRAADLARDPEFG